jgi:hypothetical protein
VKPIWRRRAAWVLVGVTVIGWPLSAFVFAKDEPQFVLGLSWLAITITAVDVALTADVRVEQEGDTDNSGEG